MTTWIKLYMGAVGVAVIATAVVSINTRDTANDTAERVRPVINSPCFADTASRDCQRIKADSDRERSVVSACIITRKAGLGCPALRQKEEQNGSTKESSDDPDNGTPNPGTADQPPDSLGPPSPSDPSGGSTGTGGGGPPSGDPTDPPGDSGGGDPPAPQDPPSTPPSDPTPPLIDTGILGTCVEVGGELVPPTKVCT